MGFSIVRSTFLSITLLSVVATPGFAYTGQKLEKGAKIKIEQATVIALKARPGRITDKELEREKGGSGLRYSFDIAAKGAAYEVGVDAQTGTILENSKEGKNPD
jgi:uncharacterized membrane protein YkoI